MTKKKHLGASQTGRAELDAAVADLAAAVHILQRVVYCGKEEHEPASANSEESALGGYENEPSLVPRTSELRDATFDHTMVTTEPTEQPVAKPDMLASEEEERLAIEDAFAQRILRVRSRW